ncbi:hypothetical protein KIN20_022995 [Parelaphostrongylus tenuis]|uniref:Uncharacterized protein n=1 Tax=Parelaphostrongylus tenuis TaxID=148309 RepID=A0AAD5N636_PARTN|nr:hypothetical protein KIN20_022995 [Parelaphostrongylus tenuis]
METAVSDYIYSEYSLPPSETNVEIECDVIAKASPLSTAVSGSVSWYSMPRSETEVERMYDVRIGFYKEDTTFPVLQGEILLYHEGGQLISRETTWLLPYHEFAHGCSSISS